MAPKPKKRPPAKRKAKARKHAAKVAARRRPRIQMRVQWDGCPPLPLNRRDLRRAALAVERHFPTVYITATTNGQHASGSYHYQSRAIDFGCNTQGPKGKVQDFLLDKYGAAHFRELFGPNDWYVKDGVKYAGAFPDHHDHVHIAI